jgi:hypothetical protein
MFAKWRGGPCRKRSLWPEQATKLFHLLQAIATDVSLPEDYQFRAATCMVDIAYPDGLPAELIKREIVPEIPAIARALVEIANNPNADEEARKLARAALKQIKTDDDEEPD